MFTVDLWLPLQTRGWMWRSEYNALCVCKLSVTQSLCPVYTVCVKPVQKALHKPHRMGKWVLSAHSVNSFSHGDNMSVTLWWGSTWSCTQSVQDWNVLCATNQQWSGGVWSVYWATVVAVKLITVTQTGTRITLSKLCKHRLIRDNPPTATNTPAGGWDFIAWIVMSWSVRNVPPLHTQAIRRPVRANWDAGPKNYWTLCRLIWGTVGSKKTPSNNKRQTWKRLATHWGRNTSQKYNV